MPRKKITKKEKAKKTKKAEKKDKEKEISDSRLSSEKNKKEKEDSKKTAKEAGDKKKLDKKKPEVIKKVLKRTSKKPAAQKTEEDEIGEELKEIYEEEGEMPDMTKLERRPRRWWLFGLTAIIALGAISAVIYAGWLFWKPWESKQSTGVAIELQGPSQVINGEKVVYEIKYKNHDKVPMAYVEISANLPTGFKILNTEPQPTESENIWQIGSLEVGGSNKIKIEGYFTDAVKESQNIQALVTYKPANFSSEFQDIETLSVLPTDSLIELEVSGPAKAIPGDEVEYELKFINTSEFEYGTMELQASYPENFIFGNSEPAAITESGNRWRFNSLATNTEEIIKIRGSFSSQGEGLQDMNFRLGFVPNDIFKLQKEAMRQTEVLAGDLETHLFINGSESSQNLNFGENLRFSLTYDNTSGEKMEDVEFIVHIESDPAVDSQRLVAWDDLSMETEKEGAVSGETITWNKTHIEGLGEVEKGEEGVIDFSMPLVDSPLSTLEGKYEVTCWVEALVGKIGDSETDREIQTTPAILALNTDLGFDSYGRYFNESGETLGYGPLPPKVGETTGYHIFWNITNSLHEIQNIVLTATLPQNVSWTGRKQVGAGEINFDEATNRVRWTINRLPTSVNDVTASFEVSVRPREEDVGTFIKLITESTLEAKDQKTGDTLIINTDPISTDIPGDDGAKGKGVVVEADE